MIRPGSWKNRYLLSDKARIFSIPVSLVHFSKVLFCALEADF
jgi:hypothetical protein